MKKKSKFVDNTVIIGKGMKFYGGKPQPPNFTVSKSYRPTLCTDEELISLLEKIEVTPQKEVASLNEWNKSGNLIHQFYRNVELCRQLSINKRTVLRLKTERGMACLLLNLNENPVQSAQTAMNWALFFRTPVITVPGLGAIIKHKIGFHAEVVGIRKMPSIPSLREVAEYARAFAKRNPNPCITEQMLMKKKRAAERVLVQGSRKSDRLAGIKAEEVPDDEDVVVEGGEKEVAAAKEKAAVPAKEKAAAPAKGNHFVYPKYQPRVSDVDADTIKKLILQLPYLHVGQATSWNDLKKQTYPEIRSQMVIDQTPISFLLHKRLAGCVLISSERFGKQNMKKLVCVCGMLRVPVLIVPGLKQTFRTATALSTNCIGIFKYPTDPVLDAILETVRIMEPRYSFWKQDRNLFRAKIDFMVPRSWDSIVQMAEKMGYDEKKPKPPKKVKKKAKQANSGAAKPNEGASKEAESADKGETVEAESTEGEIAEATEEDIAEATEGDIAEAAETETMEGEGGDEEMQEGDEAGEEEMMETEGNVETGGDEMDVQEGVEDNEGGEPREDGKKIEIQGNVVITPKSDGDDGNEAEAQENEEAKATENSENKIDSQGNEGDKVEVTEGKSEEEKKDTQEPKEP